MGLMQGLKFRSAGSVIVATRSPYSPSILSIQEESLGTERFAAGDLTASASAYLLMATISMYPDANRFRSRMMPLWRAYWARIYSGS